MQFSKEWLLYEAKSAANTFVSIFWGTLLVAPAINALLGTELPTIQQFDDIVPVVVDAAYRSAWLTFLTISGLSYRNKTNESGVSKN